MHLLHVKRQPSAAAKRFSANVAVHSGFEVTYRMLLHCLLAGGFEVAFIAKPFSLVPHPMFHLPYTFHYQVKIQELEPFHSAQNELNSSHTWSGIVPPFGGRDVILKDVQKDSEII